MSLGNMKRLRSLIFFLGIAMGQVAWSAGPMIVNIDNPNFRKLAMALPDFFAAESGGSKEIAKAGPAELGRLLQFSGLFNIVAQSAYDGFLKKPVGAQPAAKPGLEGIDLVQWKSINVESVTVGEVSDEGGKYTITLRTIDINRGEMIVGKKYTQVSKTEVDDVMRRYADLILEAYTGKTGIFASKFVFVGRRTKKDSKQIYICDFDGTNVKQITRENVPHLSPTWSPDGKFITFTSYKDGNPDLFMYEYATGKTRKLSGHKGLNSGSNWAPSGKLVAFSGSVAGDVNIYTIQPDGSERKPLIEGSGLDVDPSFSPDGQYMAFVSGRYGNPHIFRATLKWEGDKVSITGDKRLTYAGWYNASPSWSPASDKIVFAGYDKDIDRFDLFMMNPDGTAMERLTIRLGNNESPSWAPNGQLIVFHSDRVGSQDKRDVPQLYIMHRDGGSQRRIDVGLYDAQTPSWSSQLP